LVFVKQKGGPMMARIAAPLRRVGLFFVHSILVPTYRIIFSIRRMVHKIVLPAKHQLVYLVSNKYATHGLIIFIVASVVCVNLQARDVRAETIGQKSLLYQIVAEDDANIVEVVEAGSGFVNLGARSSYFSDTVVDARQHMDTAFLGDSFFQTKTDSMDSVSEFKTQKRDEIETYIVQEGDTLGQIAERFGIKVTTILWANNLSFTSTIRPGDSLSILPKDGVLYTVKSGDTLSSIAKKYDVEIEDVLEENNLSTSQTLAIGKELLLVGGSPQSTTSPTTSSIRSTTSVAELFTAPTTTSPSSSNDGWHWPTDWRVITQYYGWRHTGLDVDGDYSTNSYAARGGVVIYSGWRSGYGLTVEIDHGDGFMTRYAHHASNYVSVGQVVSGGQAIAQTGTTGRSTGTHLHFEIIYNGKFQNPLDYVR
jgi:murein DD-endopeptidase MepM/ murein hydrolase activator NlpD